MSETKTSTLNTAPHMIADPFPSRPPINPNANPTPWVEGATNNMLSVEFRTSPGIEARKTPKPTRSPSPLRSQVNRRTPQMK